MLRAGAPAPSGSTTTTTAGSIFSSASSLSSTRTPQLRRSTSTACIITASRASSSPRPSWLFHNNGDGTFTDVSKETGIAAHLGKAWGVVATDINNDGRMDLFVSNDTVAEFPLRESRQRPLRRNRPRGRRRLQRRRPGPLRHGRRFRRFRSGRLDGSFRRQHRSKKYSRCTATITMGRFDDVAMPRRHRHGHPLDERLGPEIFRLRQRRRSGPDPRQRLSRRSVEQLSHQVTYQEPLLLFHNESGKSFRT